MQLHGSGLSVLRHNAAYTVGDIVHHNGPDYLARSLHILSEPSQAGSLLHEWLLRTLRDEHGTRLDTIGSPDSSGSSSQPTATSKPWLQAGVPWVCSRARRRCTPGTLVEGTTLVAPPPLSPNANGTGVTTLFHDFNRTDTRQPVLQFEPDRCARIVGFAQTIALRLERGACARAPDNVAAVHLRLGDKTDVISGQPSVGARSSHVPLFEQVAALACTNSTVVLNAVLQYTDTDVFRHSEESRTTSEQYVKRLRQTLRRCE